MAHSGQWTSGNLSGLGQKREALRVEKHEVSVALMRILPSIPSWVAEYVYFEALKEGPVGVTGVNV